MSLVFSDTTNLDGILQGIEREVYASDYGKITGNTTLLKEWTAEINLTHDNALATIFRVGGRWNYDDRNNTGEPELTIDLVSGTRKYEFTADDQGNLVLDFYRVLILTPEGVYKDITSKNQQDKNENTIHYVDGNDGEGTPTSYDKTGNGVYLDPIPNYNATDGLKILVSREGSYFLTSDTTKKPGIAGLYHEYYVVDPSFRYAARHNMTEAGTLLQRKLALESAIEKHYAARAKDEPRRMTFNIENNR